jgi:hypothetical protein
MMHRILFSVLVALHGVVAAGSPQDVKVRMVFTQHRYVQPVYMKDPPMGTHHVFLQGDPIDLAALFINASDGVVHFPAQAISPAEAVEADLIANVAGARAKAAFDVLEDTYVDGPSGRMLARWGGSITVEPKASLRIALRLRAVVEPGLYTIRLSGLRLVCEAPCRVVNHSGVFTFEVRPLDRLPERLDRLARRAIRAVDDDHPEDAERYLQRLLVEYQDGSVAFQIRRRLVARQRRWLDAAANYEMAAQLLDSGRDRLRIEKDGGPGASGSLKEFAASARKRAAKK